MTAMLTAYVNYNPWIVLNENQNKTSQHEQIPREIFCQLLRNNNYFHFLRRILQLVFRHYPIHYQRRQRTKKYILKYFVSRCWTFTLYELSWSTDHLFFKEDGLELKSMNGWWYFIISSIFKCPDFFIYKAISKSHLLVIGINIDSIIFYLPCPFRMWAIIVHHNSFFCWSK